MPIGIVGKEELAREVAAALGDWTPARAYEQEAEFQAELHEYLDARLNAGGGKILDSGGNFVVERAYTELECDVVVSDTIGIAIRRDLVADQIKQLAGRIREYQKAYTHVVIIACGSIDRDEWEKLQNTYDTQQGMNNDPGSTPVLFLRRREPNYGKGDAAENYQQPGEENTERGILKTTISLVQRNLRRLRSPRDDD
ncbi:MAG: hypothetical protein J07HN6_00626 [Halonotius sp. J07HN6]|nr:MAG: hypothetical protein J07HN6_00626 [Halonotius sp. J07HN6]